MPIRPTSTPTIEDARCPPTTLRGCASGKWAPPTTNAMLAANGGISHGSCVTNVSAPTRASATKLAMVSTTMTLRLWRGGAPLTYHGVRGGPDDAAETGAAEATDCSLTSPAREPIDGKLYGGQGFGKYTASMTSLTLVIVRDN